MKIRKKDQTISLLAKDIKKNCSLSNAFTKEEIIYMCENKNLFNLKKGLKIRNKVINPNCYSFLGRREGILCASFYFTHSKIFVNIELDKLEEYVLQIKI